MFCLEEQYIQTSYPAAAAAAAVVSAGGVCTGASPDLLLVLCGVIKRGGGCSCAIPSYCRCVDVWCSYRYYLFTCNSSPCFSHHLIKVSVSCDESIEKLFINTPGVVSWHLVLLLFVSSRYFRAMGPHFRLAGGIYTTFVQQYHTNTAVSG